MKLLPYAAPPQPGYGARFVRRTLPQRFAIEALLFEDRRFRSQLHDYWVFRTPDHPRRPPVWQPKLYLCVRAADYWRTVRALVEHTDRIEGVWKFYMAPEGYERPDKIIVYPPISGLERVARSLARLLRGTRGHPLRHACPASAVGLARRADDFLYVGSDPKFLGASWREYRTLVEPWSRVNRAYLADRYGSAAAWLRRMNVSPDHEGPAALRPTSFDTAFALRYWRHITAPLRRRR